MSLSEDRGYDVAALVRLGITAAERCHHERARRYLEAALALDPLNEDALLWLAAITEDRERAAELVRRALQGNPASARAQAALRWLDQTAASTGPSPRGGSVPFRPPWEAYLPGTGPRDVVPSQELIPDELLALLHALPEDEGTGGSEVIAPAAGAADEFEAQGQNVEPAHFRAGKAGGQPPSGGPPGADLGAPKRRGPGWVVLLRNVVMIAMLTFIVLGTIALVILLTDEVEAQRARLIFGVITITPTATPSPSATSTPDPSPTPLPTATQTHTPTATPAPTATLAPTLGPTATPLPDWVAELGPLPTDEKWIEVDLTNQTLRAYEGEELVYTAAISSGRPGLATRQGRFRIETKHRQQTMVGADYYLPNVPYVQYFTGSIALHGIYWQVNWGTPSSHGCVNLSEPDAAWLFDWTDPPVPEGMNTVHSSDQSPGTIVLVHK